MRIPSLLIPVLASCGGSPPEEARREPAPATAEPRALDASPRCPRITTVGAVIPARGYINRRSLEGSDGEVAYDEHVAAIASAVSDLFASFASEVPPEPEHHDAFTEGPWPAATFPCIDAIEEVSFDHEGAALASARLRLTVDGGPITVTVRLWLREGSWRARSLPDVEGARTMRRIQSWLARSPEVEALSSVDEFPYRRLRVRDGSGSTLCIVGDERGDAPRLDPICWRDPRPIAHVWALQVPLPEEPPDAAAETDEELGESDESEVSEETEDFVRLALGPFEDRAEVWDIDPRRARRRYAGALRARPRRPEHDPFWTGRSSADVDILDDAPSGAPGAWEPIVTTEAAPWAELLRAVDVAHVASSTGVAAAEIQRRSESGDTRTMLCVRADRWACGPFDVSREDWELSRRAERVERLDDRTFVVESAMRMHGGNGEGSGAYGSAELYVVAIERSALSVAGWIAVGGMSWELTNLCGWDDGPCYHRLVSRAYYPWSVPAPGCLEIGALSAEHATTDGEFVAVRRAGGRARPVRRERGAEATRILAEGFPEDEASGAMHPLTESLSGSWRWDGTALERASCATSGAPARPR